MKELACLNQLPIRNTPVTAVLDTKNSSVIKDITEGYIVLSTRPSFWDGMLKFLTAFDHAFVEIEGGYRMQAGGGFVTEQSVLVRPEVALELVRGGWVDIEQESVLHLHSKDTRNWYRAELVFFDKDTPNKDLGWFRQVSEVEALGNPDGYTKRVDTGEYFTTTPLDSAVKVW